MRYLKPSSLRYQTCDKWHCFDYDERQNVMHYCRRHYSSPKHGSLKHSTLIHRSPRMRASLNPESLACGASPQTCDLNHGSHIHGSLAHNSHKHTSLQHYIWCCLLGSSGSTSPWSVLAAGAGGLDKDLWDELPWALLHSPGFLHVHSCCCCCCHCRPMIC